MTFLNRYVSFHVSGIGSTPAWPAFYPIPLISPNTLATVGKGTRWHFGTTNVNDVVQQNHYDTGLWDVIAGGTLFCAVVRDADNVVQASDTVAWEINPSFDPDANKTLSTDTPPDFGPAARAEKLADSGYSPILTCDGVWDDLHTETVTVSGRVRVRYNVPAYYGDDVQFQLRDGTPLPETGASQMWWSYIYVTVQADFKTSADDSPGFAGLGNNIDDRWHVEGARSYNSEFDWSTASDHEFQMAATSGVPEDGILNQGALPGRQFLSTDFKIRRLGEATAYESVLTVEDLRLAGTTYYGMRSTIS